MLDTKCPRCFNAKGFRVSVIPDVNGNHYQCRDPECMNPITKERTEFRIIDDEEVCFPYNVIFKKRSKDSFYRKSYLVISSPGISARSSQSLTSSSEQ